MMDALRKAIEEHGIGVAPDIVKVDSFFNHRVDVRLMTDMGRSLARAFADADVDLVLTIEASGIPLALTTAQALGDLPVVFAKKGQTTNVGSDVYAAPVYSFTHRTQNMVRVSKRMLQPGQRVLIVDDFLANGAAVNGLRDILKQAGCVLAGVGIGIEKGFQSGGKALREQGIRLESLAVIKAIEDGRIVLED